MNKVMNTSFYFMGIFLTLGAFMINIGGMDIAVVNIFIAIVIIIQISKHKFYISKYKNSIILFFCIMVISTMVNIDNLGYYWKNESIKATLKYTIFLLPLVIFFSNKEILLYRISFFKGLRISCQIQLFWELAQLFLWNISSISLNEIIFGKIMNIQMGHTWTFISDGRFRPSGVSWEPANLGLCLVIGYILSKNKYWKLLFIIGSILSTSRTGMLVMGIIVFLDIIYGLKKINKKNIMSIKKKDILIINTICILGLTILLCYSDSIISIFKTTLDSLTITINKFMAIGKGSDSSSNLHIRYYKEIFFIFNHSQLIQILFGYGTAVAGIPYTNLLNIYHWMKTWNPESDFITILMGNGIFGLILYYQSIFRCLRYNIKDIKSILILVAIVISGILYIYIRSSWTLIILIMLLVKNEDENLKVDNI